MSKNKLWGGRFTAATDEFVEAFTASVSFDQRFYKQDIAGSVAHATMLAKVGVLTDEERAQIIGGLSKVEAEIEAGNFNWRVDREDVHMNIEARLTELIGDVGKKLHTGRSRNDQVATDLRLFLRDGVDQLQAGIRALQAVLLDVAEREVDSIIPGFTHLQAAQPISFGHHMMAWFEMLVRDHERFSDCRKRINVMPLGAAALAGTTYPIDRKMTAELLGFDRPASNSLDAVSDRDFAIEFVAAASMLMMHLSRFSEELVQWSSTQFDFVDLGDGYCTGSSIMPQKKNPDVPELVRGKTGRVVGHNVGLLMLMKSQPLAYNKDNQEDKEPVFDTLDTVVDCLRAYSGMLAGMTIKRDNMRKAAIAGYSTATDLADYLVRKGVPFRDAHEIVGTLVRNAIEKACDLADLGLDELQAVGNMIEKDVYEVLTLEGSVNARDHLGGTAPQQVRAAIKAARKAMS